MRNSLCSKYVLLVAISVLTFFPKVHAQLSQSLIEDWRSEDFNFSARMMATDRFDNIYVVGDTVVGDFVVIKKFSTAGALLWQSTHDPAERLRAVWIAVDGDGNAVVLAQS